MKPACTQRPLSCLRSSGAQVLVPGRWRELSPLLDRALDLDGEARAIWLGGLRAGDPTLAAELDALLTAGEVAGARRFLEQGPLAMPFGTSLAGQVVGTYTLLAPIGQGGMGSVWLARRNEGEVAIKLLNAELIGRIGEERFRREGTILARLTHPNIAHLIDAGVSPWGQPYLVLEHVEGEHLDLYCDSRSIDIEHRVRLFLDLLDAVAHAHSREIVHRDLKPSNVLVSGDGRVKLLDFGIAKLLDGDGAAGAATALSRDGASALTPEFAAPEQMTGDPITIRTDIYALGALLYLLLSGRHPAGAARSSPAQLVRAIVDTEPLRLSRTVGDRRDGAREAERARAAQRDSTPERLRRELAGDLDTIVGTALRKRPADRYATVQAFADDLRRYLDRRPISARARTAAARVARFLRWRRPPVAPGARALLSSDGAAGGR
jgi:eukaryotic-like serine/threonine-protein kinase